MITSPQNRLLLEVRRAATSGSFTEDGLVVAEGPHLLEEALRGSWSIEQVLTTVEGRSRWSNLIEQVDAETVDVSDRAFRAVSAIENSQGLLALLRPRKCRFEDLPERGGLLVVLDAIQDPGNAGTIVRSAEAFGASGVVLLKGSVRVSNGKFLRGTAGSLFRLPYFDDLSFEQLHSQLTVKGLALYALSSRTGLDLLETDFTGSCALVIGNEGTGVCAAIMESATVIRIPTANVESLNAGVAGSIALFEAMRQRQATKETVYESF